MAKYKTRIEELMDYDDIDLMQFDLKGIKRILSPLVKAGNQRIERLKKSRIGVRSPVLYKKSTRNVVGASRETQHFTTRVKTRKEAINEYMNVTRFLKAKTSTVTGVKSWYKNQAKGTPLEGKSAEEIADILNGYRGVNGLYNLPNMIIGPDTPWFNDYQIVDDYFMDLANISDLGKVYGGLDTVTRGYEDMVRDDIPEMDLGDDLSKYFYRSFDELLSDLQSIYGREWVSENYGMLVDYWNNSFNMNKVDVLKDIAKLQEKSYIREQDRNNDLFSNYNDEFSGNI